MGARQSKRSVDITTTPKKEGAEAVGDAAAPGDGKLERIEEADTKPTTNGIAPHADVAEDKEKDKDDATEKDKEKQQQPEEVKAEEAKPESTGESPAETAEVTTPTEATAASPNTATSPDTKETKKKDKMKKKWSFRSISFSKKDKNKPSREEAPKNGDVTKEEPLAEGGEEAENGSATAGSPMEDKSGVSSPSEKEASTESAAASDSKEEGSGTQSATPAASSPLEEKKEEPTPSAPTPVPVEEKKEELEKVDAEKKVVEVSRAGGQSVVVAADPVEVSVFRVQPVATPSIIERKTSEDIPSQPPSSPPPTPIDPSPLQQAHQAQATAKALAEVLKMPASETADQTFPTLTETVSTTVPITVPTTKIPPKSDDRCCDEVNSSPVKSCCAPSEPANSSEVDEPKVEVALAPPRTEALPVVDQEKDEQSRSKVDRPDELPQTQQQDPLPPSLDTAAKNPDLASKEYPSPSKIIDTADVEVPQQIPESRVENGEVAMKEEIKEKREVVGEQASSEVVEEPEESETVLVEDPDSKSTEGKAAIVEETFEEEVVEVVVEECSENDKDIASTLDEKLIEKVIEPVEITPDPKEEVVLESVEQPDLVIESEEGPIPVSEEEFVVEAKPAVVIPEDEAAEEVADTDADTSKVDTESIEVIELTEEKLENEMESDMTIPAEEAFVADEPEDVSPTRNGLPNEPSEPIDETIVILEDVAKGETNIIEIAELEEPLPPPPPESTPSSPRLEETPKATESVVIPSPPPPQTPPNSRENLGKSPEREPTRVAVVNEALVEPPTSFPQSSLSEVLDVPQTVSAKGSNIANESQTHDSPSRLDEVSASSDDFPPAPVETVECTDPSERSLPPEELSCPLTSSNVSEIKPELPVPEEEACSLRSPTEMLLTPPRSPSPRSNVSLTTKESFSSSQMQSCDELSNREFKMETTSISLNSHNESEIELEGRLAESQAEMIKNEEESFSKCHLSNNATPPATQEIHQTAPEVEAPVENHVAHDVSPTECLDEAPKVAPPAVPIEAPASPPSAPVITEDVASVTKAIEEIDISDKAVAAATIECNATEIIADAPHQNNINE